LCADVLCQLMYMYYINVVLSLALGSCNVVCLTLQGLTTDLYWLASLFIANKHRVVIIKTDCNDSKV